MSEKGARSEQELLRVILETVSEILAPSAYRRGRVRNVKLLFVRGTKRKNPMFIPGMGEAGIGKTFTFFKKAAR